LQASLGAIVLYEGHCDDEQGDGEGDGHRLSPGERHPLFGDGEGDGVEDLLEVLVLQLNVDGQESLGNVELDLFGTDVLSTLKLETVLQTQALSVSGKHFADEHGVSPVVRAGAH